MATFFLKRSLFLYFFLLLFILHNKLLDSQTQTKEKCYFKQLLNFVGQPQSNVTKINESLAIYISNLTSIVSAIKILMLLSSKQIFAIAVKTVANLGLLF